MDWTTLLFGFRGRINRAKYWLAVLIYTLAVIAYTVLIFVVLGGVDADNLFSFAGAGLSIWAIGFLLIVVMTWSGFATGVKRLHDRDKSGWWILLFWLGPSVIGGMQTMTVNPGMVMVYSLASLAIVIWGLVELGFLRGTSGANAYGPDPLGGFSSEPLR
jgi:uncharacterized membrane protein YhaH (DUF805 family)